MLEDIYYLDESLTEDDYYDAILYILGDVYPDLTEEELEDILEDKLNDLPIQMAESVLGTIGNVGKKIGAGALQFSSNNPDLVKVATTAAGTALGGPVGASIGNTASNYLIKGKQGNAIPQTGKALTIIQDPQTQAAIARATLGVGNGTAPLSLNGTTSLIPVATYLRAVIMAAQQALREMDMQNIVPNESFSESLPFTEDIDLQAEWLAEQLFQQG